MQRVDWCSVEGLGTGFLSLIEQTQALTVVLTHGSCLTI